MEAMWMWFIPAVIKAKELIAAGEIGEPKTIIANFGFAKEYEQDKRLFDLSLGGGALLEMGIYPLAIAQYLFGKPDSLTGKAVIGKTGVDETCTAVLSYADGRIANCTTSIRAHQSCELVIAGTEGYLTLARNFWNSERLSLFYHHKPCYELYLPLEGNGYEHEIRHVNACVRAGKIESYIFSWDESPILMDMMDSLRAEWGLRYPQEI